MALEGANALIEAGHEVVLITPNSGPLVDDALSAGMQVGYVRVPVLRKEHLLPHRLLVLAWASILGTFNAVRVLRHHRPDRVVANTSTQPVWSLAARLTGSTVVVVVHEAEAGTNPIVRAGVLMPLVLANELVVVSETAREFVTTSVLLRRKRIHTVRNGRDWTTYFRTATRDRADVPKILVSGRLSPRKGQDLVLQAAHRLRVKGIEVEVLFAGDVYAGYEWFQEKLENDVRLYGLQGNVTFLGFVDDMAELLERADVCVVPSRVSESFGLVAAEAMAAMRPVIVSSGGGLTEIVEHGKSGLVFQSGDAIALAATLEEMLAKPKMAESLALAGYERVNHHFGQRVYRRAFVDAVIGPSREGIGE